MINTKSIHRLAVRRECRFCKYTASTEDQSGINSPWLKNSEYAALVSVGALVPGWSLVCPVDHAVNLTSQYIESDFWDFVTETSNTLKKCFGSEVRFFEHGALKEGSITGCGTDHAHLHAVPLGVSLAELVRESSPEINWVECLASEVGDISQQKEYLFMSDGINGLETKGHIALLSESTSQFFRKVIAGKLNIPEFYDYKKFPMSHIAESSADTLHAFTGCHKKVVSFG